MSASKRSAPRKPQRRFQFIDNSNIGASGANSTQVRRHVMQEYMREKRWESRTSAEGEVLDDATRSQNQHQQQHQYQFQSEPQSRPESYAHPLPHPLAHAQPQPQAYLHQRHAKLPLKRSSPKLRSKARISGFSRTSTINSSDAPGNQLAQAQSSALYAQPSEHKFYAHPQDRDDAVEEIPKLTISATQGESKKSRQGFYLTPQCFAAIADIGDMPPLTPTSVIISGGSMSPNSPASSLGQLSDQKASLSPEPKTILSASRTDPFNSLPMTLTKKDQELFDFYATVMPACSYGFERRSPRAHNWYLSVFIPEAMKSPVAFQNTILVHAANTQAWVQGLAETSLAIEHRARASTMLSQHFQRYPFDISDAAISSTLSAAALEDFDPRKERRKYAWMHWNAAVQKIRDRGGPSALEQKKSLRMLINWSDYIFSGYNGHGSTFYFDHRFSPKHLNSTEAKTIAQNELAQQCEDFITFLKCAESLALVAANIRSNPSIQRSQPMRYSIFGFTQPLYRLLASPNGPRYTETGQLKQIISRLAALMTINVAIWEYRYSTAAIEAFFYELDENIRHNNLDQHTSVEALLQILLSGSNNPELVHTERPWLVGRLLKVAKRLSRNSWEQLNEFLLQCLTLELTSRPTMETWEHQLRAEILSAPLVSYVLPLMQP